MALCERTPHLRLEWAKGGRRAKSLTRDLLLAVCSRAGVVHELLFLGGEGKAYVTFGSADDAERLRAAVHAVPLEELRWLKLFAVCIDAEGRAAPAGGILAAVASADFARPKATLPVPALRDELPPIPGLLLIHDFLSREEEEALASAIDAAGWAHTLSRRVMHFGYVFDYKTRSPVPGEGGPTLGPTADVAARISDLGLVGDAGDARYTRVTLPRPVLGCAELAALLPTQPFGAAAAVDGGGTDAVNQVTVNEYLPGQGISGHIDTHSGFQDGIASLSLLSDTVMELCREGDGSPTTHHIVLPRRSLLVLRGEARHAWTHRITGRITDAVVTGPGVFEVVPRGRRVSVTFRAVRTSPCRCVWPSLCFDQDGGSSQPAHLFSPRLQEERAAVAEGPVVLAPDPHAAVASTPAVEAAFVHAVYDSIAGHFSATRHSTWPRVEAYLAALPVGTTVLDVGCGNGKYMGSGSGRIAVTGCDRSEPLVAHAAEKGYDVSVADAVVLPYRPACADVALAIALLHHISTRARRVEVLRGLLQSVRPGGHVLVYVWAQEQGAESKRAFGSQGETQDLLVPWCLHRRFAGLEYAGGNSTVVQRYCHVYVGGELEGLCADAAAALGASFVHCGDVRAHEGGALVAPAHTPVVLALASRPAEHTPVALASSIPSVAVEPVRAGAGKGKGRTHGRGEEGETDEITARLAEAARGLDTRAGSGSEYSGSVTALELWWERDNWCVLLRRD